MKNLIILALLVFVGVAGYKVSESLSHDAIILIIGFLFGVMAGIPAALIVVASQRRSEPALPHAYPMAQPSQSQPPIIVLEGNRPQRNDITATGGGTYHMMTPRPSRFTDRGD